MEFVTMLAMVGCFLLLVVLFKFPAALATTGAALVGLAFSGNFNPAGLRHLVEGSFGYFDVMLIIATAMVFMKALEDAGILREISQRMIKRFGTRKIPLTLAAMFLVMVPGMLTGSSTAAALTTGRFVIPVLLGAGFTAPGAAALVALGSILGMVAPPINVPVMIIGSGIDMPYVGFDLPLLILTIPPAILFSLWAAWGAKGQVEEGGLEAAQTAEEPLPGFKVYIPLLVVLLLMIGSRGWGGKLDVGIPLMFVLGILAALVCGRPVALRQTVVSGIRLVLPVLGILVGAGMFVQVMTVAGVRGLIVTTALDMPEKSLLVAAALVLPLFGAISAYASSSVLGVPIVLALLGRNEIVTAAALSLMAGLGDLIPPIAIVPSLVTQAVDPTAQLRRETLKRCFLPAVCLLIWAFIVLYNAGWIGRLVRL